MIAAILGKFNAGLDEHNVRWENGTVFIDVPILRKGETAAPKGLFTKPDATAVKPVTPAKAGLTGYEAGYELARLAREEGVDLTQMTREQYADYAVKHQMQIDDSQLWLLPSLRVHESLASLMQARKSTKPQNAAEEKLDREFAEFAAQGSDSR